MKRLEIWELKSQQREQEQTWRQTFQQTWNEGKRYAYHHTQQYLLNSLVAELKKNKPNEYLVDFYINKIDFQLSHKYMVTIVKLLFQYNSGDNKACEHLQHILRIPVGNIYNKANKLFTYEDLIININNVHDIEKYKLLLSSLPKLFTLRDKQNQCLFAFFIAQIEHNWPNELYLNIIELLEFYLEQASKHNMDSRADNFIPYLNENDYNSYLTYCDEYIKQAENQPQKIAFFQSLKLFLTENRLIFHGHVQDVALCNSVISRPNAKDKFILEEHPAGLRSPLKWRQNLLQKQHDKPQDLESFGIYPNY